MNIEISDNIELIGKTQYGKNQIDKFGSWWKVTELCSTRLFIENDHNFRWIDLPKDKNFSIKTVLTDQDIYDTMPESINEIQRYN